LRDCAFSAAKSLFEPGGIYLVEAAISHRNVQPLIDESFHAASPCSQYRANAQRASF
jgi:hypothetical protein